MNNPNPPRRRGSARLTAVLAYALVCLAAACGSDDEGVAPQVRTPEVGTYQYEARLTTVDTLPPDTLSGTFQITHAHPDSLRATWTVQGYRGASVRGTWNVTAYSVPANGTSIQGSLNHRVWRQNGSAELSCTLNYQRVTMPADTFNSSNPCWLERIE